jgi:GNAT superfamily N-acetyltransferase
MITQMHTLSETEITMLKKTWRGKKLLSYFQAYGTQYEFCRFFRLTEETHTGFMLLFNATLLICAEQPVALEETATFVQMHLPFRIECPASFLPALSALPNYQKLRRTMFALTPQPVSSTFQPDAISTHPNLTAVYHILHEGFPNLLSYPIWLTDTSHRCRHQVSQVLTYRDSTTLTVLFDIDNCVLIGQVATCPEARGSGYARDFLRWLANQMEQQGKYAVLYALDIRVSFYREIGFQEVETEWVLERSDVEKEDVKKGAL